MEFIDLIYRALTKYVAVYLFHLVPIAYFASIVFRLMYYKFKYHQKISYGDKLAALTVLVIVLDYVNYLYLLISQTGKILPRRELIIKYTIGFLLWSWMLWYSYKAHLQRHLTKENLKKHRVIIAWIFSMFFILTVIGIVFS